MIALLYIGMSILSLLGIGAMFNSNLRRSLGDLSQMSSDLAYIGWSYMLSATRWTFAIYSIMAIVIFVFAGLFLGTTGSDMQYYYIPIIFLVPASLLFLLLGIIIKIIPASNFFLFGGSRAIAQLLRIGLGALCIFLIGLMIYGLVPQPFKRFISSLYTQTERSMDEHSIEVEAGHFGETKSETVLVNLKGEVLVKVPSATKVKLLSSKTFRAGEESEGLLKVMLLNGDGKFIRGKIGYIPSRDISYEIQSPSALISPKLVLYEKRPDGTWVGGFPVLEIRTGEAFYLKVKTPIGIVTHRGSLVGDRYEGVWSDTQKQRGRFKLNAKTLEGKLFDKYFPQEGWLKIVIRKEAG